MPVSPRWGLEGCAAITDAAAVASAAETRLEMGELTLASRVTLATAPPSPHSWPSASISGLPAQPPPRQAVRTPTAPPPSLSITLWAGVGAP